MRSVTCFIVLLLSLSYCGSGVNVLETKADDHLEFDRYQTFDFFRLDASGDTAKDFSANLQLLKQAISAELESKGLRRSSESPDLLVNIGIVVEEKVQTRETTFREAPVYMGQRRYHWESEKVEVGRYREGTVTVDLVDRVENKGVWEGVVEGIIPKRKETRRERINEGVRALFEKL